MMYEKNTYCTFPEELKINPTAEIFVQNEDNLYLKPIMKLIISFEMEENITTLKSKRYMKTFMHSDMSLLPAVNY